MKTLLAATALFIALTGAGRAETVQTEVGTIKMSDASLLVRDMIGEPVYNFRGRPTTDAPMPLAGARRFDRIGRITDVMIRKDGMVEAIIMGVGGFWGLADREMTADIEGVTIVTDVRGDKYFVIFTDDEALGDAPRFNKFDIE